MEPSKYFSEYFDTIHTSLSSIDTSKLAKAAEIMWECSQSGKKIMVVGNGGIW